MLFSKLTLAAVCLKISLATVTTEDSGDCAAFPKDGVSVGEHAMLQHSATPSAAALPQKPRPPSEMQSISRVQHLGAPSRGALKEFGKSVKAKPSAGKSSNRQVLEHKVENLVEKKVQEMIENLGLEKRQDPEIEAILQDSPTDPMPQAGLSGDEKATYSYDPASSDSTVESSYERGERELLGEDIVAADAQSQEEEQKASETEPACDWHCYLSNYPDLEGTYGTDDFDAAEQHWKSIGKSEGRSCTCDGYPTNLVAGAKTPEEALEVAPQKDRSVKCDWDCYLNRYPDLVMTYGTTDYEAAQLHWAQVGKPEGRICTCEAQSEEKPPVEKLEEGKLEASESGLTNFVSEVSEQSQEVSEQSQGISEQAQEVAEKSQEVAEKSQEASEQSQEVLEQSHEVSEQSQEISQQSTAVAPAEAPAMPEESTKACNWECYLNRYTDLTKTVGADNFAAAEAHWKANGKAEGRDCTCDGEGSLAATPWMDSVTSCQPSSVAAKEALQEQIKAYEESDKFQQKIQEATGEVPISAGHVAIMKYLREKVLKPSMSVLELGCAAAGVLRFVKDEYTNGIGAHGSLVGVELVPGWVKFAQEQFKDISIFEGDITDYSLPDPYTSTTFDLVMLNDVMGRMQKGRYGCFFSQLDKATHKGSLVYMHDPSPMALIDNETQSDGEKLKAFEHVVPHHFVVSGMAMIGFELVDFEHDMDTVCGGEGDDLPKQLEGAHCYSNGWPKYTHNVYRKVGNSPVLKTSV